MSRFVAAIKFLAVIALSTALSLAACVLALDGYVLLATRGAIAADLRASPTQTYALVLGTSLVAAGTPGPTLEERLDTARALYSSGRVERLIVSGMATGNDYDEARTMAAWLVAHGVRPDDIVADSDGFRTAASIANAVRGGVKSALIVSQRYHLPRALYFARHAGVVAVGVVAPDEPADRAWSRVVRETVARAEAVFEVGIWGVTS